MKISLCSLALGALLALPVAAQQPRGVVSRELSPALAFTHGPAAARRLNNLFDATPDRADLPDSAIVAAPLMSEKPPLSARASQDSRPVAARLHQELVVPVPIETPSYRRTFRIMLSQPRITDRFDDLIYKYARRYHLDARFLKSIMAAESEFDPRAVSPAGARGLMQVMPATSEEMGVSAHKLHDPEQGIKAGAIYIRELFKMAWRIFHLQGVRYTDVPHWVMQRVVAAYHAGPKYLTRQQWFASTRAYVRKVVLFYHSKVTDLRRPPAPTRMFPSYVEAVAPGGTLF